MSRTTSRALPGAIVALALLATACVDRSAPTAPPGPPVPAPSVARAADHPGAHVDRTGFLLSFFGGDPRYGLAAIVLAEPGDAPLPDLLCAMEPVEGSPQRTQFVFGPKGRVNVQAISREAYVEVYEYAGGIVTDPCQLVGAPVVASGTVRVMQHIGDPAASGNGAFVFQLRASGVVDLVRGGQARLRAMVRWVVRPDGTLVMDEEPVELIPF